MKTKKNNANAANRKYGAPFDIFSFNKGKNCATRKVLIQLLAKAQLCVAPTASGPTSSDARMKGTGPSPKPKLATNRRTAMAERTGVAVLSPMPRRTEAMPMPAILPRMQALRPMTSESGAQAVVMTMLSMEMKILSKAEPAEKTVASSETPYIITELIPSKISLTMVQGRIHIPQSC